LRFNQFCHGPQFGRRIHSFWHLNGNFSTDIEEIVETDIIFATHRDIYDLQRASSACGYCSTPLSTTTIIPCQASSSSAPCPAMFCNRLCLSRSSKTHPLLCPSQNPSSIALLSYARKNQWMALHALSQITSRVLLATQSGGETLESDWNVVQGLAALGMEERSKDVLYVVALLSTSFHHIDNFTQGQGENQIEPVGRKRISYTFKHLETLQVRWRKRSYLKSFASL
jgi:hypothetical protein